MAAPPPPVLTYLAFDFGTRRVGVASGNSLTGQATPLATIEVEGEKRWQSIAALVDEWSPDALVVGVPLHPDGAAHVNTRRARRFAAELRVRAALPVHEVDERYSTVEAAADGAAAASGADSLDARAAAVILEQYLAGAEA